jgi:PilZ domain
MSSENRRSPRFAFYASAEITELQTETRLTARTSELSRHGCYMDMVNPLPIGTTVKIQVRSLRDLRVGFPESSQNYRN